MLPLFLLNEVPVLCFWAPLSPFVLLRGKSYLALGERW